VTQVGRDGFSGVGDIRDIWLAILAEGGGDADDHGFDFANAAEVGRGSEGACLDEGGDLGSRNVLDVALPLVDGRDLGSVNIETDDADARAGKLKRERKADVAQTDDRDLHMRSQMTEGELAAGKQQRRRKEWAIFESSTPPWFRSRRRS